MKRIRGSIYHKKGNMIAGLYGILDGLCLVLSFGNWSSKNQLDFNISRRTKELRYDAERDMAKHMADAEREELNKRKI